MVLSATGRITHCVMLQTGRGIAVLSKVVGRMAVRQLFWASILTRGIHLYHSRVQLVLWYVW